MIARLRSRVPRLGRWPRLALVGCCLLLALQSAVDARAGGESRRPGVTATRPVVVAARDLPAGHSLTPGDLRVVGYPTALAPAGAQARAPALLGRRLAAPLGAREPVLPTRLLGRDLTTGLAAGFVAVAVPVNDSHVADLVHPGDRIDVLGTGHPPDSAEAPDSSNASTTTPAEEASVAERLIVLAVLRGADSAASEVVVASDHRSALRLTRAAAEQALAVVGEPP